jgi:Na+/H+ antiporter
MVNLEIYILLFVIIAALGIIFRKSPVPTALLLVIVGMLLSLISSFPKVELNSTLVLDLFLPLLIYQISRTSSWRELKQYYHAIAFLAVGHVFLMTILVAVIIHWIMPETGWPLAFLIGAIVSPPDDVAIISVSEKIRIPHRIMTVLKGEAIFNDATALILFRFALAVLITHQFHPEKALLSFFLVVLLETLYGLMIGNLLGSINLKVREPILQMTISLLTPLIAYFPAERLGGCGILATAVAGFTVADRYYDQYQPEGRLILGSVWSTLTFWIESILFLYVGLEMRSVIESISAINLRELLLLTFSVIMTVIAGRFIFVYPAAYLARVFFPKLKKEDPTPSWQQVFIISWAGMRGGISLAAALAVPPLVFRIEGIINPRDLLIFIVFCVVFSTLVLQGLALPWMLKILGVHADGKKEQHLEQHSLLKAQLGMIDAVIHWLLELKEVSKSDVKLNGEIEIRLLEYKNKKNNLENKVESYNTQSSDQHNNYPTFNDAIALSVKIMEIERDTLFKFWHEKKINHAVKLKLLQHLDYRSKTMY